MRAFHLHSFIQPIIESYRRKVAPPKKTAESQGSLQLQVLNARIESSSPSLSLGVQVDITVKCLSCVHEKSRKCENWSCHEDATVRVVEGKTPQKG